MINKWRDGALLYIGRCRCGLASVRDLAAHKTVDESGFGVHCGAASLPVTPILTEQVVDEELTLHTTPVGHGTLFALNVRGDSMIDAAIFNGDIVVVRQQTVADNGDIVAAMIDDEATVKVYRTRGGCGNSFG